MKFTLLKRLAAIAACLTLGLSSAIFSACGTSDDPAVDDPAQSGEVDTGGDTGNAGGNSGSSGISSDDPDYYGQPLLADPDAGNDEIVACEEHKFKGRNICGRCGAINLDAEMSDVAVHDPSIIACYYDADGIVYSEAAAGRKKVWFVFGTQLACAYSFDLEGWAYVTPTFYAEGTSEKTSDYREAFKTAAKWSGHKSSSEVQGNLWAADIIYNKEMGRWCLYYSVNGDSWLSSIVLATSRSIAGPYAYRGTPVYGGFDEATEGGLGNEDYSLVTGEEEIPDRYFPRSSGQWDGTYGVSCIDPAVFYDEDGALWLAYGSWSGGIFLLRLNNETGLRDLSYDYGYKDDDFAADGAVWDGTALAFDPYMGVHIAGGYYVSGEGAYIEYIDGYYYLFISYGFYSPDGGYNMRMFRSQSVTGPYVDYNGNSAVYSKYIKNYPAVNLGVSVMQNYKWNCMDKASVAQGHNSALWDDDGNAYIVYHTKYDDGGVGHNVEVHRLVKNAEGWYIPSAFEKSDSDEAVTNSDGLTVAGTYGVILHKSVSDFASLSYNKEQRITLNADGSVTGSYSGKWSLTSGTGYITITIGGTEYKGALMWQNKEGGGAKTLTFTCLGGGNTCFWGYQV